MKTRSIVVKSWDELVFENRNKTYGAYLIRKSYSKNLVIAWGISVFFACLLLISPQLRSWFGKEITTLPKDPIIQGGCILLDPPVINPIRQASVAPPATRTDLPPVPTAQLVEQEVPETVEATTTGTSGTETGTSEAVAYAGNLEGTVVEPFVPTTESIRDAAEIMPQYRGGEEAMVKFIRKKIHIPSIVTRQNINGKVYVSFVVDKKGNVTDVKIMKGLNAECDKEAMRVISMMTDWIAGSNNNIPVSVRMALPIRFQGIVQE